MARRNASKAASPNPTVGAATVLSTRDHILDRTIFLIAKKGTTDVTVREIAREAGVNVAAVNYYFSSKEQMFSQMADRFLAGYAQVMSLLKTPGVPPEQRLRRWCGQVMYHLAAYPGFLSVMERHMTAEPRDPFGNALRSTMQRAVRQLRSALRECVGPADEERIGFKLTLLVSALAGPLPRLVGPVQARPGRNAAADRSRFLDLMIEHLRR